ncbi:FAD:protein FMN transferase [Candidatus Magnetominusculus dajiuhuensis]|uniref:FAD:protein FMN transferase n=1 Tax=Candidatus Magnetominusculus dajiuhuensis TaxID=3137712 RepID=UPI003B438A94
MKPKLLTAAAIVFVLALIFILKNQLNSTPHVYKKSEILMDTLITLTVVTNSEKNADEAIEAAFNYLRGFERMLSFFNAGSEVSAINKNAGVGPVKVSSDTYELTKKAVENAKWTSGSFNPAIGPAMVLWDFKNKKRPTDSEIKKVLPLLDYTHIVFNDNDSSIMLKDKGMLLDLGGIAKGYAADKTAEILKRAGMQAGIASMAGDISAWGTRPDGSPWRVGIRAPRGAPDDLVGVLSLKDLAVSTAGDYERFFIEDGVRYHHILVPATGYPARDFQSVTIVNPKGVVTDALDTGLFAMDREKALRFVEKNNLMVHFIFADGSTFTSPNLKGLLENR